MSDVEGSEDEDDEEVIADSDDEVGGAGLASACLSGGKLSACCLQCASHVLPHVSMHQ